MSINNALINATREVLRTYLAPELAEKLTEEILNQARPEIEAALITLAGFEFAKPATKSAKPVGKAAKAPKAAAGRRNKEAKEAKQSNDDAAGPPVITIENYAVEAEAEAN